jgi:hypothetical protein
MPYRCLQICLFSAGAFGEAPRLREATHTTVDRADRPPPPYRHELCASADTIVPEPDTLARPPSAKTQ